MSRMEFIPGVLRGVAAICAERKDDSLGKEMRDQNGEYHQAVRQQGHRQQKREP